MWTPKRDKRTHITRVHTHTMLIRLIERERDGSGVTIWLTLGPWLSPVKQYKPEEQSWIEACAKIGRVQIVPFGWFTFTWSKRTLGLKFDLGKGLNLGWVLYVPPSKSEHTRFCSYLSTGGPAMPLYWLYLDWFTSPNAVSTPSTKKYARFYQSDSCHWINLDLACQGKT